MILARWCFVSKVIQYTRGCFFFFMWSISHIGWILLGKKPNTDVTSLNWAFANNVDVISYEYNPPWSRIKSVWCVSYQLLFNYVWQDVGCFGCWWFGMDNLSLSIAFVLLSVATGIYFITYFPWYQCDNTHVINFCYHIVYSYATPSRE
jgi:hypothetical protein